MRLDKPRIQPLADDELDPELTARIGKGPHINVIRTLANHPKLARRWMVFANHVMGKSTLDPRERELAILRIGYLCRSGYEWGQHVLIARECGVTDAEVERLADGADAPGWSERERVLLRATDELHADAFITDATWAELEKHYSLEQRMDIVFAVGQYNMVSMALNSFGVQLDEHMDLPPLPVR